MKVINIMNFVRQCDPRLENSEAVLYETTRRELELVREYGYDNTFLLQYDAYTDERYVRLFKDNADEHIELGLWLEIVEPLVKACGITWRGRPGWKWDWHVVPGFSMAYTPKERITLIDEAMESFKRIFGFYPLTVGSWLLDTVTAKYLCDKYHVSALAICRDQVNTDAYTLVGGYFNQAYYPSVNNIFTPAQTAEAQIEVPVFRLLGPDPVHNYDNERHMYDESNYKYLAPGEKMNGCYTMEAVWGPGSEPAIFDWFTDCYYKNEDMGFSYSQIGQENSFGYTDFIPSLRMQFEKLKKLGGVSVMKMCDTGKAFKRLFPDLTPATSVCAYTDWNRGSDVQSVYYDCAGYTANIFRDKDRIFIRSLYLFDENIPEYYLDVPCETWDAVYENLPIVDTLRGSDTDGLVLRTKASAFTAVNTAPGVLCVKWDSGSCVFAPGGITVNLCGADLALPGDIAHTAINGNEIEYTYKGHCYRLICNTPIEKTDIGCAFRAESGYFTLKFGRQ